LITIFTVQHSNTNYKHLAVMFRIKAQTTSTL